MKTESKGDELAPDQRQALLDRLCALGPCEHQIGWLDCQKVGIGPEAIPELISIALDDKLHQAPGDSPLVWGPVHAWRALASLRSVEAIEPLMTLLPRIDDDGNDWVGEEIPRVFGKIGPPAIPVLTRYQQDTRNGDYARIACSRGLQSIATSYPEVRDEVVAILSNQLKLFVENGPDINGFLVSRLIDLKAVEAAPLMEQAFAAGCVSHFVAGDWEDVQEELGLLPERKTPRPKPFFSLIDPGALAPRTPVIQTNPNSRQARRQAEREAKKKK